MTYLSPLKLAIVIVVGSMWMGLGQVVSDLPFVVNLVIVEVIAIIGLDVARFVTQVVTVEVIIDAAHKAMSVRANLSDSLKSVNAITMPGVSSVHLSKNPHDAGRFLKIFGKPARLTNSDSERSNETTLAQVFELTAGKTVNAILGDSQNRIGQLIVKEKDDLEIINELPINV